MTWTADVIDREQENAPSIRMLVLTSNDGRTVEQQLGFATYPDLDAFNAYVQNRIAELEAGDTVAELDNQIV